MKGGLASACSCLNIYSTVNVTAVCVCCMIPMGSHGWISVLYTTQPVPWNKNAFVLISLCVFYIHWKWNASQTCYLRENIVCVREREYNWNRWIRERSREKSISSKWCKSVHFVWLTFYIKILNIQKQEQNENANQNRKRKTAVVVVWSSWSSFIQHIFKAVTMKMRFSLNNFTMYFSYIDSIGREKLAHFIAIHTYLHISPHLRSPLKRTHTHTHISNRGKKPACH